jgi:hypothetical protein
VADSSEIDAALSNKLLTDPTLAGLMPDGVWFDVGKKGATKFVVVSLLSALDEHMFQGRAYEGPLYLVKAVALSTTGADVKAAAARIDALLDGGTLTITGYGLLAMQREERVRYTEVDQENDARWQHRGGHYSVMAAAV